MKLKSIIGWLAIIGVVYIFYINLNYVENGPGLSILGWKLSFNTSAYHLTEKLLVTILTITYFAIPSYKKIKD